MDRPKYPDSTGSWDAPLPSRRNEPGFTDRTEPMNRPDRQGESALDDLMAVRRHPGGEVPPQAPTSGPSWPGSPVSTPPVSPAAAPDPHYGDPELAAASRMERGHDPHSRQGGEPMLPGGNPGQPPAQGIDEPTQLHNPVQHQQHHQVHHQPQPPQGSQHHPQQHHAPQQQNGPRRNYPEQVGEGVYRRSRPGLGILLAIVTVAMLALVGIMLASQLAAGGPLSPSAVISATFALVGLPMAAWGLYPLLGMGSQSGPEHYSALLRAPYVYLLTGLVLLLAAGLAA